ncbi:MAG: gluconokinase [Microbacterium sp.]|uniref:gluconokinase n=1 Tax=Microbacterium sp. TaxID=51671 RepID=UPI001AD078EB|nr:gluconokinase [Microbacterium sp.]MBN9175891.1 gluconokinase [Microbacterium sp.]
MTALRVVVMGPSGSGKTAVGAALAVDLAVEFVDADDLHPAANITKMAAGQPLDDADRAPWLDAVGRVLAGLPGGGVVACSALKRRYRDRILAEAPGAVFVELTVDRAELTRRMSAREHFMPPALLDSQIAALEPLEADEPGFAIPNVGRVLEIAAGIAQRLAGHDHPNAPIDPSTTITPPAPPVPPEGARA